jgi:hypothetical protein
LTPAVKHATSEPALSRDPHLRRLYIGEGGGAGDYLPYGHDATHSSRTSNAATFVTKELLVRLPAFCALYLTFVSAVRRCVAAVQTKEAAVRPLQHVDSLTDIATLLQSWAQW